jgi:hypothetical protein
MMQTAFHQTRNDDQDYAVQSIGGLDYSVDVMGVIPPFLAVTKSRG